MVNGYSVTDGGGQDEKHGEYACTNDKSPTAKYQGQSDLKLSKLVLLTEFLYSNFIFILLDLILKMEK